MKPINISLTINLPKVGKKFVQVLLKFSGFGPLVSLQIPDKTFLLSVLGVLGRGMMLRE